MSDRVTCAIHEGVADVRLNRPEKMNAIDGAMFSALAEVGERLKSEPSVRSLMVPILPPFVWVGQTEVRAIHSADVTENPFVTGSTAKTSHPGYCRRRSSSAARSSKCSPASNEIVPPFPPAPFAFHPTAPCSIAIAPISSANVETIVG